MRFAPAAGPEGAPPRLLWPVPEVIAGESLMGLVVRTAADNVHSRVAPVLEAAGLPHHRAFDLAMRDDLDVARLAAVLRLDAAEVEGRRHHPLVREAGPPMVSFFGAAAYGRDLRFRRRRVAPAQLRLSAHHRATATHGVLPFCPVTGGMLIDACPRCGTPLGWHVTQGIERCDDPECAYDLREQEGVQLDHRVFETVGPVARLLEPDPAIHGPARDGLHPDLSGMDRGVVFELAWRLGRIAADVAPAKRQHRTSLGADQMVTALSAGADMLAGWPESVDKLVRDRLDRDPSTAMRIAYGLRRLAATTTGLPEHGALLRLRTPHVIDLRQRVVRGYSDDLVDGAGALRFLGIGSNELVTLLRTELVEPVHSSGERNIHATFSKAALTTLRDAIANRLAVGRISEAFGISRHGAEQLACLGFLEHLDHPALPLLYGGMHVTRASRDRLIGELVGAATSFAKEEQVLPLRRALVAIGGREKPWGPVIASLLERDIPFTLVERGQRLVDRIRVRRRDVAMIARLRFVAPPGTGVTFADTMPRRDAQELLNLTPIMMSKALAAELGGMSVRGKELSTASVLEVARARISGGEMIARYFGGDVRAFRAFAPLRGISRLGITGWDRGSAEHLLARAGVTPIERGADLARPTVPATVTTSKEN